MLSFCTEKLAVTLAICQGFYIVVVVLALQGGDRLKNQCSILISLLEIDFLLVSSFFISLKSSKFCTVHQ